ncbi:MAG: transposase family protein, partial [Actinomycetes bacterium]
EATCSRRDAASVLFDLPGYRVLDAVDTDDGRRQVKIASTTLEAGCPSCGVLSARVNQRVEQRLTDASIAGRVEVVLVRPRFACTEPLCAKRTFVEVSEQVPSRARVTMSRVRLSGRAVESVLKENLNYR